MSESWNTSSRTTLWLGTRNRIERMHLPSERTGQRAVTPQALSGDSLSARRRAAEAQAIRAAMERWSGGRGPEPSDSIRVRFSAKSRRWASNHPSAKTGRKTDTSGRPDADHALRAGPPSHPPGVHRRLSRSKLLAYCNRGAKRRAHVAYRRQSARAANTRRGGLPYIPHSCDFAARKRPTAGL